MSRLDARLAKLENISKSKPVIWAFVPRPVDNAVAERDKDKEMLREFASRYFGISDFYFSIFTLDEATSLSFSYIEYADFCEIVNRASDNSSLVNETNPPSQVVHECNEVLANFLDSFLFGDEATGVKPDAA